MKESFVNDSPSGSTTPRPTPDDGSHANGSPNPKNEKRYTLQEFPKEFKRNHFRTTDWRFLGILLLSTLATALFIYYEFTHLPADLDEDFIIKIQNQYVNRFLEDEIRSNRSNLLTAGEGSLRSAADFADALGAPGE